MRKRVTCPLCEVKLHRYEQGDHIRAEHPESIGKTRYELVRIAIERWNRAREAVTAVFGWRCLACGREPDPSRPEGRGKMTIDHVVPRAEGGADDITNWQPLCFGCNNDKGASYIDYRTPAHREALRRWLAPCEATIIGRMRWCSMHEKPMGHAVRKTLDARGT